MFLRIVRISQGDTQQHHKHRHACTTACVKHAETFEGLMFHKPLQSPQLLGSIFNH